MHSVMVSLFATIMFAFGLVSTASGKSIGCFIAYEAQGGCNSAQDCKAGFNKVWFEDSSDIAGSKPQWLSFPSKAESEIYYQPRNKFINGVKAGDPQSFAASFGDLMVFEPNTGRTAAYNYYYKCKAKPE